MENVDGRAGVSHEDREPSTSVIVGTTGPAYPLVEMKMLVLPLLLLLSKEVGAASELVLVWSVVVGGGAGGEKEEDDAGVEAGGVIVGG